MSKCPISGLECKYKKDVHVTDISGSQVIDSKDMCVICGLPYLAKQGMEKLQSKENLIANLINFLFTDKNSSAQINLAPPIGCKTCGQTIENFLSSGRIGCSDCYEFYKKEFIPMIEKCQESATQHVGKMPSNNKDVIIKKLEEELLVSIKKEDYETAASIKARIEELRQ
jgi:protein-arginine kinase activator protein McsA